MSEGCSQILFISEVQVDECRLHETRILEDGDTISLVQKWLAGPFES